MKAWRQRDTAQWLATQRAINEDNSGTVAGEDAVVVQGNTDRPNRIDAYYGGRGTPDGPSHGHVVSNDGENVSYWREPGESDPFIDDRR